MAKQPVTVFIVDDSAQVAEMLGELVADPGRVEVVGTADSVGAATECIARLAPDVVFVDLQLKDGNGFQVAEAVKEPEPPPAPAPEAAAAVETKTAAPAPAVEKDEEIFEAILSKVASKPETGARKTAPKFDVPATVITHNPLGVGASAFGVLTFFLCLSLTLLMLFLGQTSIVRHWPQTALLYKLLGFHLQAPGEGLRISEVVAEQRVEDKKNILVVQGKMTNMSEHPLGYPPLHVVLRDGQHLLLKEWNLKASATRLSSGETVPVMLQLPDAPASGASVDMRVQE